MSNYNNIAKAKAIERDKKMEWLRLNPKLNDDSGIYFLTRVDENGINYFYIGQSVHILTRLAQHMVGHQQHIDKSLRGRNLYSKDNPYGWKAGHINYPIEMLDEMEQYWIIEYMKKGYQCRYNKTSGSQGSGKEKINEYKPSKGYLDGLVQGRKNLARDINHIIDKHLIISLRKDTKISQKALDKFYRLLSEEKEEV